MGKGLLLLKNLVGYRFIIKAKVGRRRRPPSYWVNISSSSSTPGGGVSLPLCGQARTVMGQWKWAKGGYEGEDRWAQAEEFLPCVQKLHNSRNSIKAAWWRRLGLAQIRDKKPHIPHSQSQGDFPNIHMSRKAPWRSERERVSSHSKWYQPTHRSLH